MPTPVHTDDAPAAIGPYSQAVSSGGFVFTAGQIALDPASGQVVAGGVAEQNAESPVPDTSTRVAGRAVKLSDADGVSRFAVVHVSTVPKTSENV